MYVQFSKASWPVQIFPSGGHPGVSLGTELWSVGSILKPSLCHWGWYLHTCRSRPSPVVHKQPFDAVCPSPALSGVSLGNFWFFGTLFFLPFFALRARNLRLQCSCSAAHFMPLVPCLGPSGRTKRKKWWIAGSGLLLQSTCRCSFIRFPNRCPVFTAAFRECAHSILPGLGKSTSF